MQNRTTRSYRMAADDQYEAVIDNVEQGPGKYEGEGAVGEWAWDKVLEGWGQDVGDEYFGVYTLVTLDKPVLVNDPDGTSWTFMGYIAHESDQGFVYFDYFDTVEKAEARFAELEAEYEQDLEDSPRDDY